ncbi:DUF6752 domain-containing protein [Modestobacter sp. NPDC049651]|uniref:DUF6752 domain-containing protein n=1 Tax=unclassified Modestobacter TaxID=2643866 RepID=UPI0033FBCDD8
MTHPTAARPLAAPVRLIRRALAPAALELQGRLPELRQQNEELARRLAQAEERLAVLEDRAAQADRLAAEVGELREGLHESRRLNLRVAELTDLVTELVLPLHDREIDPAVLARLGADTL